MFRRFLPVLFFFLTTAATVTAVASPTASGDGEDNQNAQGPDTEEDSDVLRPLAECSIPAYSDPTRVIRESAAADYDDLLLQGRCYLACASHISQQASEQQKDWVKIDKSIAIYWPTVVGRNCNIERMVSLTWLLSSVQFKLYSVLYLL